MPHFLLEKEVKDKKQGGINNPCRDVRKMARRRDNSPNPLVGSGFDVDSDNSKPETIPPLNLDCPL